MALDLNQTARTEYSTLPAHRIQNAVIDSVHDQDFTAYTNERFSKDWGYVVGDAKLWSGLHMKATWAIGKGIKTDILTKKRLELIDGNGKQSFRRILYDMIFMAHAARDSFAEIIWNDPKKRDWPLNLRILDPSRIVIVFKKNGRIDHYEQIGSKTITFQREDIFHLSNRNMGGSTHGTSVPEILEKLIIAGDENFDTIRRAARFQAVPFLMFKVKSDNATTIANFKTNIREARRTGDDLIIPDDENILTVDPVSVTPSTFLLDWKQITDKAFYQALGLPLILFGTAGSTEGGGKIEYAGHETVFECDQLDIEEACKLQLHIDIDVNAPTSLLETLKADEDKDAQNALRFQPNDVNAGRGR